MKLRIATFNVENLFTRPSAMKDGSGPSGQAAIEQHAELNAIIRKETYTDDDKARLLELDAVYKFSALNAPANALVKLNKVRGQLFSRSKAGVVSVVADGINDWTGWFELPRVDVTWKAIFNTARVIAETNPDILVCVEAEDRPTLVRFNEQVLGPAFGKKFPHVMVVDGNDDRGIDVGILSRFPIIGIRSHVDDRNANGEKTFSRDCPEYVVQLPGGVRVVVIPNHFKSKRGGNDQKARARRRAQAVGASAIARNAVDGVGKYVVLAGDLNDTPDSEELSPLWAGGFADVQSHPSYPTDRPGTFDTGTARNKIDYLILSAKLATKLKATGIERRGSYHPSLWEVFDTVDGRGTEASDHHLLWADFEF